MIGWLRTSNAAVVDLEVALEFLVARPDAVEGRLDDLHRAGASARATPVEEVKDVGETSHETEVGLDAAAEPTHRTCTAAFSDPRLRTATAVANRLMSLFDERIKNNRCHRHKVQSK